MPTPDKPGGTPPKYSDSEKQRAKSAGYTLRPSDYFIAGAKDFAEDVKGAITGASRGPSFEHRKKLMSEDK